MMTNALSSSFSASLDGVLNYAGRFRKQYGFIVVVLDHINEQQNHIEHLTAQLYPILKKNVRATDTIIRFTQDSWLICLDDCNDTLLQWTQYVLGSALHRRKLQTTSFDGALTFVRSGILEANTQTQATQAIEHELKVQKTPYAAENLYSQQ
jgi:GGDEF domain-containing protein